MSMDARQHDRHVEWWERAGENVDRWGQQDAVPLVLAKIEELAELSEVVLENAKFEDTDVGEFTEQRLQSMTHLGRAVQGFLESTTEDLHGRPIPPAERPSYGALADVDDDVLAEIQDELGDDAALSFQLAWALEDLDGGGA